MKHNIVQIQSHEEFYGFGEYKLQFGKLHLIARSLNELKSWDTSTLVVYLDQIYQEQIDEIIEILNYIITKSALKIKFITNSILIYDIAIKLKNSNRILFSSPILIASSPKFLAISELQKKKFRTFGYFKNLRTIEFLNDCKDIISNFEIIYISSPVDVQFNIFQELTPHLTTRIKFIVRSCTKQEDQFYKMYQENIVFQT